MPCKGGSRRLVFAWMISVDDMQCRVFPIAKNRAFAQLSCTLSAATTNRIATTSILSDVLGDVGQDEEDDGDEVPPSSFFSVQVNMDDVIDPTVREGLAFQSPNVCVAFKAAVDFDVDSHPLLMIRVPVAGFHAEVGEPQLSSVSRGLPNTIMTLRVTRQNEEDLLKTVYPGATASVRQRALAAVNLEKSYGKHITYDVVNRMFQAMAPNVESWDVVIQLTEPYSFKELDTISFLSSKSARDVFILAPLENTGVLPEKKKVRVITDDIEEASQ